MAELIPKAAVAAAAGVLLLLGAPILTALCVGGLVFLWRASPGPRSHAGRASGRRLSEEDGWLIVEIMIGAVVLILAGLAIYSGLDSASKASGENRNRTVAAYLAQQDQERMRTMDAAALSNNYTSSRTVTVANVPYRVDSKATLVNDATGSVSCTNKSSTAQYLKITSTVYDPAGRNAPVVQDSLLSPKPADGNAAVQVVDRTGTTGVSGVPVALQEPPAGTVTTDDDGCSLFGFLDNGTQYHVSFSLPGYVDVNGSGVVSGPITVVPGNVSLTQFQYDRAGSITASFPSGKACTGITVANGHMKLTPPTRSFPQSGCTASGGAASNTAANLFPFTDAYAVYAGVCPVNDPTNTAWRQPATYAGILTPGGAQSVTPAEPPVTVTVTRTTGSGRSAQTSPYQGADVKFTETDCSGNTFGTVQTGSNGQASLGVPYGRYSICVDDNQTPASSTRMNTQTVTNGAAAGQAVTININANSSTLGSC